MIKKKYNLELMKEIINHFGGPKEFSEIMNVHTGTIGKWLYAGARPSVATCYKIERLSEGKYKILDIRPDLDLD